MIGTIFWPYSWCRRDTPSSPAVARSKAGQAALAAVSTAVALKIGIHAAERVITSAAPFSADRSVAAVFLPPLFVGASSGLCRGIIRRLPENRDAGDFITTSVASAYAVGVGILLRHATTAAHCYNCSDYWQHLASSLLGMGKVVLALNVAAGLCCAIEEYVVPEFDFSYARPQRPVSSWLLA